jgi:soluble lytic murein transglycosylase-like protein
LAIATITLVAIVSLLLQNESAPNVDISEPKLSHYAAHIVRENPKVPPTEAEHIVVAATKWALEFNIDPKLLLAIAKVESNYYKYAISNHGAYGLMQVIPVWHKDKILEARKVVGNPEIFNIDTNMYLGARVIKDCLNKHGKLNKALMCYSGQTPEYDKKVLNVYTRL